MSTEPERRPKSKRPDRKRPYAKPVNDGFVVFYVDGFAQLTPEQRKWPVVSFLPPSAKPQPPEAEAKAGE